MNGSFESKSEVRARLDELEKLSLVISSEDIPDISSYITQRTSELYAIYSESEEDLSMMIDKSHEEVCVAKQMEEDEAYGQDPAAYYTLALCGEAGELANAITKSLRNGYEEELVLQAIESELPDIVIYAFILAKVMKMDLNKMVKEKVEVVIERARSGYYGKPIRRKNRFFTFNTNSNGQSPLFDGKKCYIVGISDEKEVKTKCRAHFISSNIDPKVLIYDISSDITEQIDLDKEWYIERDLEKVDIFI